MSTGKGSVEEADVDDKMKATKFKELKFMVLKEIKQTTDSVCVKSYPRADGDEENLPTIGHTELVKLYAVTYRDWEPAEVALAELD